MFPNCSVPVNASWQNKHMPVTSFINRLLERAYKSQIDWINSPQWEQNAMWSYAEQLAARWKKIYNCHCQDY